MLHDPTSCKLFKLSCINKGFVSYRLSVSCLSVCQICLSLSHTHSHTHTHTHTHTSFLSLFSLLFHSACIFLRSLLVSSTFSIVRKLQTRHKVYLRFSLMCGDVFPLDEIHVIFESTYGTSEKHAVMEQVRKVLQHRGNSPKIRHKGTVILAKTTLPTQLWRL